jgi:hypothetical protein
MWNLYDQAPNGLLLRPRQQGNPAGDGIRRAAKPAVPGTCIEPVRCANACAPTLPQRWSVFSTMYYQQSCPTCGRSLRIRVAYLGRKVYCQHCHAAFMASEPGSEQLSTGDSSVGLLQRAEELLEMASRKNSAQELD